MIRKFKFLFMIFCLFFFTASAEAIQTIEIDKNNPKNTIVDVKFTGVYALGDKLIHSRKDMDGLKVEIRSARNIYRVLDTTVIKNGSAVFNIPTVIYGRERFFYTVGKYWAISVENIYQITQSKKTGRVDKHMMPNKNWYGDEILRSNNPGREYIPVPHGTPWYENDPRFWKIFTISRIRDEERPLPPLNFRLEEIEKEKEDDCCEGEKVLDDYLVD